MTELLTLLAAHVRPGGTAPAQRFRVGGAWSTRTYGELADLVSHAASSLTRLGVGPRDRVAILLPTRADWTVVDLAAAGLGATVVPIYPTSTDVQVADLVSRSAPRVLVTEASRVLPDLGVVHVARLGDADGDLGALAGTGPVPEPPIAAGVGEGDVFTIGFSSGTTGAPKGCLMTHANYAAVVRASREFELDGAPAPAHRRATFIYLPLAHASARLHQLVTLALGGELVYGSGGTDEVLAQVAESRPTYVAGVPRLFESAWVRAGSDPTALRAAFGGDLAYALTGGAPIAPELLVAYRDAGISLVEGYGLTETATALTLSAPHDVRSGSVGRALGCVELRIATSGEILARGANVFAGYLDDEASTAAAFVDGWFRTGDLGRLDDDGYLYLTGRLKNLVVTSTGKNVAPEPIENALRLACGVSDVVVVGDRRPYLVALVAAADEQHAALAEAVRQINANVSPPERIRKLVVVPTPFADQAGLVTASGKTVRPAVTEHWADLLATAYADEAHPRVVDIDRPAHLRAAG